jgi:Flp pilus assembly protein TadG
MLTVRQQNVTEESTIMFCRQSSTDRTIRRGASLPFLAVTLVALMGFLALGIDVGMMLIAKAEVQNAADLAALTAARTLNGDATNNYNQSAATTNAQNILSYNTILGQPIQASQLQLTYGSYDYDQNTQTFSAHFPPMAGKPVTAVTATVTSNSSSTAFGTIFGIRFLPIVTATAMAVHRPRDIALVLDLSGSMRMGTCLGFDFYTNTRTTNNPDPLYPKFGHYSSNNANMQGPSTNRTSSYDNYTISPSNTTVPNASYSLTYVNNFYQNDAYAAVLVRAFDSYTSTDGGNTWSPPAAGATPQLPPATYAATPGGDMPLFRGGSTSVYATNVQDIVGSTSTNILWELDGYSAYAAGQPDTSNNGVPQVWSQVDYSMPTTLPANGSLPFNGYTQGPGYYGMTFFIWPPDPRNANALSGSTLTSFLNSLGITNTTDQTTLANVWGTWQGMGATGLAHLQDWLKGTNQWEAARLPVAGPYGPNSSVFVPNITTWNGSTLTNSTKPRTYHAVCRLFNRAYPGGAAWSSTPFHADWRLRFFSPIGNNNTNNNTVLFNKSGSLNVSGIGSTFTINYSAILGWISQSISPSGQPVNPFPQQLRAGRIKYYGSIPTQITGSWPNYGNTDQRFWKEFIDYVLGFRQTGPNTYYDITANANFQITGYGNDFAWGTIRITAPPSAPQYMSYTDIPARPRLRYWFGPLNMVDYLHNMNMSELATSGISQVQNYFLMEPGDAYEAPLYSGKQAFLAAINTMQTNHPNDWFSIICYSWPRSSANGTVSGQGYGRFNCVRSPLGPNYDYARSALLFPFSTINADGSPNNTEITPYDADPATGSVPSADLIDTPRGDGDTCFAMGLMLAYNQFAMTDPSDTTLRSFVSSSPIHFPTGMAGGMGRKGAQKVVIFETDGLANCTATASLVNAGSYKYYKIRYDMNKPNSSEYPSVNTYSINNSTVLNQIYSLVQQLANDYGSPRNPFRLYAIGFGPVFQGPDAAAALQTLQYMQYYAGTQSSPSTPLSPDQIITGTDAQMLTKMTNTFTNILQNGVQITLIK